MKKGIDEETTRERQSRVVRSGGKWEEYVKLYLSEKLEGTSIEIIKGNENEIKGNNPELWKNLSMPVKVSPIQETIWGDIDLVAIIRDTPIAVISCKTSLHGRFTETLFWSLLFRLLTHTKVILATPDSGRGGEEWHSEWGTLDNPTKDRLLAETYLDGVYVENVEEFCKTIKPNQRTALGGIVRHLNELPDDIERWRKDVIRFIPEKKKDDNSSLRNFF